MDSIIYRELATSDELNILFGKESCYKDFCYRYDEDTVNLLKKNFSLVDSLYLFALQDDVFAGFVSCDIDWWEPKSFFLREIFVGSKYQGNHIGTTLVQKCIDHAKKHGAHTLVTQTAYENIPMQKLCISFGFTKWENPRWKEGITYKLPLKPF
jgi:RimJ/RimL family protein N-acetyltransferase